MIINRESKLSGKTYKIKVNNYSYYITINNQEINGVIKPIEIFINSKNIEHFQWVTLVTRLLSAIFRKDGDFTFIIDEFAAIHDPKGGYWGKNRLTGKAIYYNSIINEIGAVIDEHLNSL
jgi:hypothetical protein